MNEPLRVYFVQDDVNETLEEIYTNEQRPFKISLLINKGTTTERSLRPEGAHGPHSPILIEKDTDYNSFRGKIGMRLQELIEDYDVKCITPETLDHLIVGFKLYRLI